MSRDEGPRFRLGSGRFVRGRDPTRQPAPRRANRSHEHDYRGSRYDQVPEPPMSNQASRVLGRVPPGTVVTLFGLGSIGSYTGRSIVSVGGNIIAIDNQVVELANVEGGRSAYSPRMVHSPKVMAFAQMVEEMGLNVKVLPLYRAIETFSDHEIRSLAQGSAAIVAAFDDPEQLVRVNDLVYPLCSAVYPGFHRGGRSGHVIWTSPGMPCFSCALGISSAADIHTLHAEPALPLDIQRISQMAARVTLWLCSPQSAETAGLLDPSRNIIFLDNRPSEGVERALSAQLLEADSDPSCPICGPFAN